MKVTLLRSFLYALVVVVGVPCLYLVLRAASVEVRAGVAVGVALIF